MIIQKYVFACRIILSNNFNNFRITVLIFKKKPIKKKKQSLKVFGHLNIQLVLDPLQT